GHDARGAQGRGLHFNVHARDHLVPVHQPVRPQIRRCTASPMAPTTMRITTFTTSWRNAPLASLQSPNAIDRPMSAAAGMVVTETNTPMSVLALASVSDTTPTIPASTATMTENAFGESIRSAAGRCRRSDAPG